PYLARCDLALARSGSAPAARAVSALDDLTRQERAVARLVGAGLSNRDVAAELVVSVKTVEFHLSNVYAKLGLSSRGQLILRVAAPAS
ncbi:MAG: helix-turn-helix transcriptional regulator, partial [Euzebyales bacterium]|nr:helix-turn-helix transcriptional regulator [Euzebyales bacterium]